MKIENEIEKLIKRVTLLETQNSRFKNLLDSAVELTNQCGTSERKDEHEFLQETIQLIEDEKVRMEEDLDLLSSTENEGILYYIKHMENDCLELRRKVNLLLKQIQKQTTELDQLKIEQMEFKFLLTHKDSDHDLLKNIISIDTNVSGTDRAFLLDERQKLQRRIVNLESKKSEFLTALENMDKQTQIQSEPLLMEKCDLEHALFKAIDDVAKKKYQELHLKVLNLEKVRSQLLNDLQSVLDQSRREIADEYSELQKKIQEIESKKAELQLKLKINCQNEEMKRKLKERVATDEEEKQAIDDILNAFTNRVTQTKDNNLIRNDRSITYFHNYSSFGLPTCTIL